MSWIIDGLRAPIALVLLSGCGGDAAVSQTSTAQSAPTAPAPSSPPPPMWRDIAAVQVLCLVHTPGGVDSGSFAADLCDRAREAAEVGSPAPVSIVKLGDPAILRPEVLTLLVHASITDSSAGPLAALMVRPFRNLNEHDGLLFSAAPEAVLLDDRDHVLANSPVDRALKAALAKTLPWGARPAAVPLDRP